MATVLSGNPLGIHLLEDTKGRTYVKGLWDTRRKLMSMGMERNLFEKLIKESAIIAAKQAARTAPVQSGSLAMSIRGQASKKYTSHGVTKRAYGGVVLAGTPTLVQYARRVSYGSYTVAGQPAKASTSQRGYARRVWRETRRGPGNPYIVRAREKMKPKIVAHFNGRIRKWIIENGFESTASFYWGSNF